MLLSPVQAAAHLRNSIPVAIPTETVWGLAACVDDPIGIERIFSIKGRPHNNPLIIHLSTTAQLYPLLSSLPQGIEELIATFWPGSLTLVLPILENRILPCVRAGLPSAAFRMPDHPVTLSLIDEVGPLVAPSANRSGTPSATTIQHIEDDFGPSFPILCPTMDPFLTTESRERSPTRLDIESECPSKGIESTILIWNEGRWDIGRYGAIWPQELTAVLGYLPVAHHADSQRPLCPGQLYRHYAPQAQLVLSRQPWNASESSSYDAVLGFSERHYSQAPLIIDLGPLSDPGIIGRNLYARLREIDRRALQRVFIDFDIPIEPAYLAIIDRLTKAAHPPIDRS